MAESTLNTAFYELQGEVGFMLGFGRGQFNNDNTWDAFQTASIDRCVKGGLRNFYHCGFEWSFLKPDVTLALLSGVTTVSMPDDFGGLFGEVTISATGTIVWEPLPIVGIGTIDSASSQMPTTTGRPRMVCLEPLKGTFPTSSQRYRMRFFPIPDTNYNITFQYYLNPDYLTGSMPYAYGGPEHAETLLYSCLATAEGILDDRVDIYEQKFQARLEVSKELDRRKKPQKLGYNRDLSDVRSWWPSASPIWHAWSTITVNGVQP